VSKLATKKHGSSSFGSINTSKKGGTPEEFASILAQEIRRLKLNPKIGAVTLVAQGLGTIEAEGGFDGGSWGGDGTHIGPFAMEPSYGSTAQRMNKVSACRIALEHWKSDGETWVPGWWKWETGETEGNGGQRANKFHGIAAKAVAGTAGGSNPSLGEEIPLIGGAVGDVEGAVEGIVGGAVDAGEFLAEMAETLLDFRKLGQLAAEALAWFIRLLAKALWDYAIAPIFHWTERAVIWYGDNFYGSGTETGSGFGAQLRANAGIITIAFWAIGYGVLWTDGESLSPAGGAQNSMAGRAVKGVEGKIARRNLVKPNKVKEKTPDKPKPKASTVQIERAQTFSVGRKRPVSVTSTTNPDVGRITNASSQRQAATPAPVQRPTGEKQIHLPAGVKHPAEKKPAKKATLKLAAKSSGTGVGA
jgi:hypothetical protein